MNASTWLGIIFGGAGGGTLILLAILKWGRGAPKDKSEIRKEDAETYKLRMEAEDLKAKTDIGLSQAAMDFANRLNAELLQCKADLEKSRKKLEDMEDQLNVAREALMKADVMVDQMKRELAESRNRERDMTIEIEQLKAQITRIQRGQNRQP